MSVWSLEKTGFFRYEIADLNRRQRRAGGAEKKTRCQVLICAARVAFLEAQNPRARFPAASCGRIFFALSAIADRHGANGGRMAAITAGLRNDGAGQSH